MKHLKKRVTLTFGLLAVASVAAAVVVACSDDTSVTTDAGTDGGPDAQNDNQVSETGTPDAGPDVINVEAGTLEEFMALNASATCERYKECCTAAPDAGTFNLTACIADFKSAGWDQSLTDLIGVADGGKVTYDAVLGGQCLTAIRNMTCKNTTAAEFKNAWVKCYAAAVGTGAASSPCGSSAECATTQFCDPDGGTCAPLKAANAACNSGPNGQAECSYRGVGTSQCLDDGTDSGVLKCLPQLAAGKACNYDWQCASGACSVRDGSGDAGVIATCEATTDFLYGICDAYPNP